LRSSGFPGRTHKAPPFFVPASLLPFRSFASRVFPPALEIDPEPVGVDVRFCVPPSLPGYSYLFAPLLRRLHIRLVVCNVYAFCPLAHPPFVVLYSELERPILFPRASPLDRAASVREQRGEQTLRVHKSLPFFVDPFSFSLRPKKFQLPFNPFLLFSPGGTPEVIKGNPALVLLHDD